MVALLWLLWIPLSAIMHGFLISTFWKWFVSGDGAFLHDQAVNGSIPMDISVIQSLGLSIFISYFLTSALISVLNRLPDDNDSAGETFAKTAVSSVVLFVMFLLIGAIYHAFM